MKALLISLVPFLSQNPCSWESELASSRNLCWPLAFVQTGRIRWHQLTAEICREPLGLTKDSSCFSTVFTGRTEQVASSQGLFLMGDLNNGRTSPAVFMVLESGGVLSTL